MVKSGVTGVTGLRQTFSSARAWVELWRERVTRVTGGKWSAGSPLSSSDRHRRRKSAISSVACLKNRQISSGPIYSLGYIVGTNVTVPYRGIPGHSRGSFDPSAGFFGVLSHER